MLKRIYPKKIHQIIIDFKFHFFFAELTPAMMDELEIFGELAHQSLMEGIDAETKSRNQEIGKLRFSALADIYRLQSNLLWRILRETVSS